MKNFIEAAQYAFAALGGALGAVMGGFDGFLYALVVFVIVDYATGLMAAAVEKKLSSEVGFKGIFKKVIIFSLVAVGHIIDANVIREGSVLRTAVIFFYLCVCRQAFPQKHGLAVGKSQQVGEHPKPGAQRVLFADVAVDQQPDFF